MSQKIKQQKEESGPLLHRSITEDVRMEVSAVDEDTRTITLSVSSEQALVPRMDPYSGEVYLERLGHEEGEIDLEFFGSGRAPLCLDHDRQRQIGVIQSVVVSDGVLRALCRLSRSTEGTEILQDVVDGIRTCVSVGYYTKERVLEGETEGTPIMRVTSWQPFEASLVSVPADSSVGVGRSNEAHDSEEQEEVENEATEINNSTNQTQQQIPKEDKRVEDTEVQKVVDTASIDSAVKQERERTATIQKLGQNHKMGDAASKFVAEGKSVREFQDFVLENLDSKEKERQVELQRADAGNIGLSEREKRDFSFVRLVRYAMDPTNAHARKEASFEIAVSEEAARRYSSLTGNESKRGIVVPTDILMRDLTSAGATTGKELVGVDHLGGSFIEALRNRLVVMRAGATPLANLQGNVSIPKQTGVSTGVWISTEGGNSSNQDANFTTGSVTLSPKTVGANIGFSRTLLLQSSPNVESLVMNDVATALATAIDLAALSGTGADGQPTGLSGLVTPGEFDLGAYPSFGDYVGLETAVATDNADIGSASYITNPSVRGDAKTREKATNTAQFICADDSINGYAVYVTNQVSDKDVFFGYWNQMFIGMWGGLDIVVDPYTGAVAGNVRVTALQTADIVVRHPESFAMLVESAT